MQIVKQDILTLTEGVIIHQCNARGVMGAGLAKAIRAKYPQVYSEYMKLCNSLPSKQLLGLHQVIQVTEKLKIVNIFGQMDFGRKPGATYTDYAAVETALLSLRAEIGDILIACAFNMGCGLGGGDWEIYSEIIQRVFPKAVAYQL